MPMKGNELRATPQRMALPAACLGFCLGFCLGAGSDALAQDARKTGGSPLDTLMRTRLWADVPEAKDFVRQTRPSTDQLDYQPTRGTDPERPKVRTGAELEALQRELERAGARHETKAEPRTRSSSRLSPKATRSR